MTDPQKLVRLQAELERKKRVTLNTVFPSISIEGPRKMANKLTSHLYLQKN